MKLKHILKKLIHERGITITHLARESGVAQQTLHNWMSGTEPRSLTQVKRVADYFEVSVDYICFGINEEKLTKPDVQQYWEEINAGVFEVVLRRVKK